MHTESDSKLPRRVPTSLNVGCCPGLGVAVDPLGRAGSLLSHSIGSVSFSRREEKKRGAMWGKDRGFRSFQAFNFPWGLPSPPELSPTIIRQRGKKEGEERGLARFPLSVIAVGRWWCAAIGCKSCLVATTSPDGQNAASPLSESMTFDAECSVNADSGFPIFTHLCSPS